MKRKLLSLAIIGIIISSNVIAQQHNSGKCATMEVDKRMREENPEMGSLDEFEEWMAANMVDESYNAGKTNAVIYNIPVIVHVIHNGEAIGTNSNISDAQIQSQIVALNKDFTKTNSDWSNTPAVWTSRVADCQINFFLTTLDQFGSPMPTPGIERINRTTMGWVAAPYSETYVSQTIKPNSIWNPKLFLNIWVCNLGGVLLGYATFPPNSTLTGLFGPFGTSITDGVVVKYNCFGTTGNLLNGQDLGRTTTHEIGHYLGIRHVWGDDTCASDYCNDTPTQFQENFGSPNFPSVSNCPGNAPNGDMFMNYMDYCDDNVAVMFTNNQKTRMHTALTKSPYRYLLIASTEEQVNIEKTLSIYPNPSNGLVNLNIELFNKSSMEVKVYDILGNTFYTNTFDNNKMGKYTLDLTNVSNGIYFVELRTGKETMTRKINILK